MNKNNLHTEPTPISPISYEDLCKAYKEASKHCQDPSIIQTTVEKPRLRLWYHYPLLTNEQVESIIQQTIDHGLDPIAAAEKLYAKIKIKT